jgi:hypothetical protein
MFLRSQDEGLPSDLEGCMRTISILTVGRINSIRYAVRIAMIDAMRVQYLHREKMFSEVKF